ncbi:MAG: lamin tail domain-containing protein, partial [Verrucomicrobiae bacterium]|nr:lamin tail domain-containing protein [Verrucomicrobiae bacterium]
MCIRDSRASFERRYGALTILAGEYSGRLDNAGETIRLIGPMNELVQEFRYDGAWYPATRGLGFALVPVNTQVSGKSLSSRQSWQPGTAWLGTPGGEDPPAQAIPPVLVNEILANPAKGQLEAIELYNSTQKPADISGWYLSDDPATPKYKFPPGTVIPPGGFLVVQSDQFNQPGASGAFGLKATGDDVYLFSANWSGLPSGYIHGFEFGVSPVGATYGRYISADGKEHFVLQAVPSLGSHNTGLRISTVVISEIMYHPPDLFANGAWWDATEDEYIEVVNLANEPQPLFDTETLTNTWRLRGAVNFSFPQGLTMGAGERLLLVGFDPASDLTQTLELRRKYNVPISTRILGPWKGKLSNRGDTVDLVAPAHIARGPGRSAIDIIVDRVQYCNRLPWPSAGDGLGFALNRRPEWSFGDDPANWIAAAPSPGRPPPTGTLPVITEHPADRTALSGRSATLRVRVSPEPDTRYQWRKNGVSIPQATNSILRFSNLQPTDAGEYDVVVSGEHGAVVSKPAFVRVALPGSDTDADGLSDLFELTHSMDPAWMDDPAADPDEDGISTGAEYAAGTNPLDANSKFAFGSVSFDGHTIRLEFEGALDRTYYVEVGSDLNSGTPWQQLAVIPVEDTGSAELRTMTVSDSERSISATRFYRIRGESREVPRRGGGASPACVTLFRTFAEPKPCNTQHSPEVLQAKAKR